MTHLEEMKRILDEAGIKYYVTTHEDETRVVLADDPNLLNPDAVYMWFDQDGKLEEIAV